MVFKKTISFDILIFIALLLVGLYFHVFLPLGFNFERIYGDLGDARFLNYVLEHSFLYLSGNLDSFWSANFFYPFKNAIVISENLIGTAPIYALFRLLNFDRETSFQFWFVSLTLLNYFVSTYVFYKLTGKLSIAAIGGFIFAFNISQFGQYNHLQVLPRFIIPIAIYYAILFIKSHDIKHFTIFIFSIVFQFYCGIYLGFLLVIAILFIYLLSFIIDYKSYIILIKNYVLLFKIFLITIIHGALLYVLFQPYYEWSQILGKRNFEEIEPSIPRIWSYFSSTSGTYLWSWLEKTFQSSPIWWDHLLFPGAIVFVSIILSVVLFKKIFTYDKKYYAYSFILVFIFTLSVNDITLYKLFLNLPGFNSMRAIGRIINIELFYFSVFIILVVGYYYKKTKYKKILISLIVLITILDQSIIKQNPSPTYSKLESQNRITTLTKKIVNKENYSSFAYCPIDKTEPIFAYHIDAMLLSQTINLPTVNGYSGTCPGLICEFINQLDTTSLYKWTNENKINKKDVLILF